MVQSILLDVALASPPLMLGLAITWRLIWPRWKVVGKVAAYLIAVAALASFICHWSIVVGWLHQSAGLMFHVVFCRKYGFTWYAVEDPEKYVALSMKSVGYTPSSRDKVPPRA